jgi:hypothetical protein
MGSESSFCSDDQCLRTLVLRGCLLNRRQKKDTELPCPEVAREITGWSAADVAGIYLSKHSRKPYFHLKEQMLRVIDVIFQDLSTT